MSSLDNVNAVKEKLIRIYKRRRPPTKSSFLPNIEKLNKLLINEDKTLRPLDKSGLSGGILYLKQNIPTIIVPDLHARMDFFLNLMLYKDEKNTSVLEKLASDQLQIVCVGDGFHAESRAIKRWQSALQEYLDGYKKHTFMDIEMKESMGLMEMVVEVKLNFLNNFHFLKGNHENITNERGSGNYPFRKFAYEGPMVVAYVEKFYDQQFISEYSAFEKNLPIFAIGKNFLVSHAEPKKFYNKEEILNFRSNPDVIEGLTWTSDDAAEKDSAGTMINNYIDSNWASRSYYFGGHRPVKHLYNERAGGKYIQIHNPFKFILVLTPVNRGIELDHDIFELEDNTKEILK